MKINILTIFILFLGINKGYTQEESIDTAITNKIMRIRNLIKEDRIRELSNYIIYPLKRPSPIPDIQNEEQFLLYYSTLFDSKFKEKLQNTTPEGIFYHDGLYAFLLGDIWFNYECKIVSINYNSNQETNLKKVLIEEEHSHMYPTIKIWKRNLLLCENEKFLIRIDETDDGIRYISWSKSKKTTDKPDLILINGKQEFQGTSGGVIYKFKNDRWTYIVDDNWVLNEDLGGGLYLRVLYDDLEKFSLKCIKR